MEEGPSGGGNGCADNDDDCDDHDEHCDDGDDDDDDCDTTGTDCDGLDNDCDGIVDNAQILVRATRHIVGAGHRPETHKEPLVDLLVGVYDRAPGSCAQGVCGGANWQSYECIFDSCTPDGQGTTDIDGRLLLDLPPGDYVVIGGDGSDKHLGRPANDLDCGEVLRRKFDQIVTSHGKKHSCKRTRRTGSELIIIEPESVEWSGEAELYPFVFESFENWQVTASVEPPEGFVADFDELSEDVDSETKALQFTITDVGSEWVPTAVRHVIDHKGRREVLVGRVGVRLTEELASRKGLDRSGRVLGPTGRPVKVPGSDPRDERPAEIVGWVEPSVWSPTWTVRIRVSTGDKVQLSIGRDGKQIRLLTGEAFAPGEYRIDWDGLDERGMPLAAGDYYLQVDTTGSSETVRFIERRGARSTGGSAVEEDRGRGERVHVSRSPGD